MSVRRCGFAAIIGAPNVGKSTLLNRIAGSKVSIVTHKVQTTRAPVRAVVTRGDAQVVFVDTPGLFTPGRRLERAMIGAARAAASNADCLIHLVDARAWVSEKTDAPRPGMSIFGQLSTQARPALVVMNKIERIRRPRLLVAAARLAEFWSGEIMMISALTGDGVEDVLARCVAMMPEGEHLYPDGDMVPDASRLAAEMLREAVMLRLHQELPYRLTVETTSCEETAGEYRITCAIIVAEERHKSMVIGKGGGVLAQVGARARSELSQTLGRPVHLFTEVISGRNWQEDRERYHNMGLDFDV